MSWEFYQNIRPTSPSLKKIYTLHLQLLNNSSFSLKMTKYWQISCNETLKFYNFSRHPEEDGLKQKLSFKPPSVQVRCQQHCSIWGLHSWEIYYWRINVHFLCVCGEYVQLSWDTCIL